MIQLNRPPKPVRLTPQIEAQLVATFKLSGASVWNRAYIRDPLQAASHNKCAYCETLFTAGQSMEIDHFEPKQQSPDKVIEWLNFLPACRRCNGTKSDHDVLAEPILNPFDQKPQDHLKLKYVRLQHLTDLGRVTLDVLELNDPELTKARSQIVVALDQQIEDVLSLMASIHPPLLASLQRQLRRKVRAILKAAQPDAAYAAIVASFISHDRDWRRIQIEMAKYQLWTPDLMQLEGIALSHALSQ